MKETVLELVQRAGRKLSEALGHDSKVLHALLPGYEWLLEVASGGHGIPWTINGVQYRVDARHRRRLAPEYDTPVAAFLRERVRPGQLCVDVGANVGVYVLQFAHWSAPDGKVIAFEPNPGALEALRRHIRLNGLEGRARVVPAAAGAAEGERTLFASEADGMSRLGAPNPELAAQARPVQVPVVTLDGFFAREGLSPDWLFIDVEGFEVAVLEGARRTLAARGKQLGVVVEMHPNAWDTADTTRAQAEALFDELGVTPVPLTGQQEPLAEYGLVYLAHLAHR